MYSWDMTRKIRKVHANKVLLTSEQLNLIFTRFKQFGDLKRICKELIEQGKIPNCKYDFYIKTFAKYPPYMELQKQRKEREKEIKEQTLQLHYQGLKPADIAFKIGIKTKKVCNIIYHKPNNKKDVDILLYKELVNYWNNYSYEGQIMTLETKQAFELLGLEVPK